MKNFLIIVNQTKDRNLNISNEISEYLTARGAVTHIFNKDEEGNTDEIPIPVGTECILVIGGDGTILNAAGHLIGCNIPLLGINMGTLGFLADISLSEIGKAMDSLLNDDFQVEQRIMLKARIVRNGECIKEYLALNDFVIRRKVLSGMVALSININGVTIQSYKADGVIISTPTGSTGYNLSAGGPIINPTCKNYVVTPVCPHSLTGRSVILAKDDTISVEIASVRKHANEESYLLYDGKEGISLFPDDQVMICKADEMTPFIKLREISFIQILKDKLY